MTISRFRRSAMLTGLVLLGSGLAGCSGGTSVTAASSQKAVETEAPVAAAVPDLTGEWKQTNSKSADAYQSATITGNTIVVNWVSDNGDTTSLYWAGTFTAPTEAGTYSWDSTNDTEQTSSAMLASGDPTKTFTFENDEISYDVSAMGTTVKVKLGR
jgi:hypothetical protein